jgi:hypothetical protein
MAFQNLEDWKFPLLKNPIQLSQLSTSRRRLQNEKGPSERYVQPRLETDLRQLPLINLRALQSDTRALVIVLEAEIMLVDGYQVIFEGCFENTNAGHMVTHFSDDIGHHLWLQGPLNHLSSEWRVNYIIKIIRCILEFCMCKPFSC